MPEQGESCSLWIKSGCGTLLPLLRGNFDFVFMFSVSFHSRFLSWPRSSFVFTRKSTRDDDGDDGGGKIMRFHCLFNWNIAQSLRLRSSRLTHAPTKLRRVLTMRSVESAKLSLCSPNRRIVVVFLPIFLTMTFHEKLISELFAFPPCIQISSIMRRVGALFTYSF